MTVKNLTVAIAVPLEVEQVEAIRSAHPLVTVLYEPDLLPPERFPSDHAGDPAFQRTAEQEARYWQILRGADVLYGFPNDNAAGLAAIASSARLQWIQAMAAGAGGTVKAADLSAEDLARISITTSAGVHALPLAEFALMGALNGLKRITALTANQGAKYWPELRTPTRPISGSNLVITGLGEIGLETARLARALGMNVSGTKRTVESIEGIDLVTDTAGLPGLVATADVLINTLPGTPSTQKMINAEIFNAMKPETVLVNVGRGSVIDEDDLLEALNNGQVSYACLDVFAVEPLPSASPLWEHPRVLVSPHAATMNDAENSLIAERFMENLQRFQAGEHLLHTVDPVHFY